MTGKIMRNQQSEDEEWLFEQEFGADVFKEAFGDIDEPQTGLLWLASRIYDATVVVVNTVASCCPRQRVKPE